MNIPDFLISGCKLGEGSEIFGCTLINFEPLVNKLFYC